MYNEIGYRWDSVRCARAPAQQTLAGRTITEAEEGLRRFRATLIGATKYSKFVERARLSFADISNNSAIVSRSVFGALFFKSCPLAPTHVRCLHLELPAVVYMHGSCL